MTRTIRTAAEIDALPVWAAIRGEDFTEWVRFPAKPDVAGEWVSEHGDRATSAELEPRVYGLVVLHDLSAPAPAPSMVPEAAVEAFKVAWHKADDEGREGERVRDGLTAALPILTVAPSATREDVDLTAVIAGVWDDGNAVGLDGWTGPERGSDEVDDYAVRARERAVRRALDAITPRTDR